MEEPQVYITDITFNSGESFSLKDSDIVVFTGANNVGKSQVLRDIQHSFENPNYHRIIATSINYKREGDIDNLKKRFINKGAQYTYENVSVHDLHLIDNWWRGPMYSLSSLFVNHLSTENRLLAANPATSFDAVETAPSDPIQKLYIDDKKEQEISSLFQNAFDTSIILNRGAGNNIPIHVGTAPKKESGEDRVSVSYLHKLKQLPQIQSQGDGMRSFLGILLNVFTSTHTITLIDEPEAFLHPPQARLLGKMLARNTPNNRQLFISTHSEDFLKGLLDAENQRIKIIRINRVDDINYINLLSNDDIKTVWKDPILRYSNILSGLFHSKVIICESDTDCRFYQAIMDALHDGENSISPDVLFTHCGGKQRLKTVVNSLKALNVKTVVVSDIDILNDVQTFKDLVTQMGLSWDNLGGHWNSVNQYIKEQRAQLDTEDVKKQIKEVLDKVSVNVFPSESAESIKQIVKKTSAWSKVKETGKNFFNGKAYNSLVSIIENCKKRGLFIVPIGELECFYKPDSNHGTKWVNSVLENVDLPTDSELQPARDFVKEILAY